MQSAHGSELVEVLGVEPQQVWDEWCTPCIVPASRSHPMEKLWDFENK